MLVRISRWNEIRYLFTPEERLQINDAITAEVICPRGGEVDLEKLTPELKEKLQTTYNDK